MMEKTTFETKRSCNECIHSDRIVPSEGGNLTQICRFNPPKLSYQYIPDGKGGFAVLQQSLWPIMLPGDYCGKLETRAN